MYSPALEVLLQKIFSHRSLLEKPIVLVDIGASGAIPEAWKLFANHSIAIAFDPDERELTALRTNSHPYAKLFLLRSVVQVENKSCAKVILTTSPYCSSLYFQIQKSPTLDILQFI